MRSRPEKSTSKFWPLVTFTFCVSGLMLKSKFSELSYFPCSERVYSFHDTCDMYIFEVQASEFPNQFITEFFWNPSVDPQIQKKMKIMIFCFVCVFVVSEVRTKLKFIYPGLDLNLIKYSLKNRRGVTRKSAKISKLMIFLTLFHSCWFS